MSIMLIALSGAWLYPFSWIWAAGQFTGKEPNKLVLLGETILFIGLMMFGWYSLAKEVKNK
jgi:Na+/phosphate symporter